MSVGTIFSILRNDPTIPGAVETFCQPGSTQLAAGYILYGPSTVFVLTTGRGVDMFVLDPSIGSFVLVASGVRIPAAGKTYSVNEANRSTFSPGIQRYLDWAHTEGYSSRYIGSMVADVHRTLLKGGVFLYPATRQNPKGKLRLMYEGNPMAMIMEQAGGVAVATSANDGDAPARILDIQPEGIHQRTSVLLGSPREVEHVLRHAQGIGAGRRCDSTVILTVLGIVASAHAAQFARQGRFPAMALATAESFDGDWQFCRLAYQGRGWATDYPDADFNFGTRLSELTKTRVSKDRSGETRPLIVRPTDDALFQLPVRDVVAGRIASP